MSYIFPLILLSLISGSGFFLYGKKKISRCVLNMLIGLGAGSMLSLSLVHIFPEALEENSLAVYSFLAGFLLVYLIEEFLTPHKHDHEHGNHSHEDIHEHYDHVAIVSLIGISIHTLFDGVGVRVGFGISPEIGYAAIFAVALHQIPVSLSLAAIFRESKIVKKTQLLLLGFFALSASIGFILSDVLFSFIDTSIIPLIAAFAGGSLLYIATTDLMPVIHAQNEKKYLSIIAFLIGCIGMTLVRFFE
ncbi:ZIP family metal transporter [Candidatus Gracilibacteria bacterium]|nr:ZIP family metal transporter [Candidatus Gracilibacteria bacterium]